MVSVGVVAPFSVTADSQTEGLVNVSLEDLEELNHCIDTDTDTMFISYGYSLGLCYEPDEEVFFHTPGNLSERDLFDFSGGLAYSDIDNDGFAELYITHGGGMRGTLFTYTGEKFVEIPGNRGIHSKSAEFGGYFVDLDADGWVDFVSVQHAGVEVFRNDGTGHFFDDTDEFRIFHQRATVSMAVGDFDVDGDVDLGFAHWGTGWIRGKPLTEYIWMNDGTGRFLDRSRHLPLRPTQGSENAFTPTFADINEDGYPDLLMAGDFESSQVFLNIEGKEFRDTTTFEISDKNGMGAAVGDYDRDGDLDWFVSSIWGDPSRFGDLYDGNRLYRNRDSKGGFEDVTTDANVGVGHWGWGACFADFDNDGWLDIFHTNGSPVFPDDRSVLFRGQSNGTFLEVSADWGIDHTIQGRGVLCADFDDDGKIDIFIANNRKSPTVFHNKNDNGNAYLKVNLLGLPGNAQAVGARIQVKSASGTQIHEVQLGTGFLAQGPTIAHFGLGEDTLVESVTVTWPDQFRTTSEVTDVGVNQTIELQQPVPTQTFLNVVDGEGAGIYEEGEDIFLQSAEPQEGYVFSHWSSSAGGTFVDRTAHETHFTMPSNSVTVTANYLPVTTLDDYSSVARLWIEVLLQSIRNDYARPTVHARNLFHVSSAIYDAWAAFANIESPWLLGRTRSGVQCEFDETATDVEINSAREEAISYAAYRLILQRFPRSPGRASIVRDADTLLDYLGYDSATVEKNSSTEDAAKFGNHIADCYIRLGQVDDSNEQEDYANKYYSPINDALRPERSGNPTITDLNRWQPLRLFEFIDQAGNPSSAEPTFIGAEWGAIVPFALREEDLTKYERDDYEYWVYHDPGAPPYIDGSDADYYRWGFELVSVWSAELDASDGVTVDISPGSLGNIIELPETFEEFKSFYQDPLSSEVNQGHITNPSTDLPYDSQVVNRGDYTRVLAEFWADGPDSETPPGHWYVILNTVADHPDLSRQMGGVGPVLGNLEWDVKSYFALGGAMHDSAIAAWGVKGWYDYIRPISSIRAMADRGQSSDSSSVSYHEFGIGLQSGFIELVEEGDELAGNSDQHVGKIKVKAWRGPDAVKDETTDVAGVGWILAEDWWPYQRPSFVTPPFAGYVSGHSTYSRAAAEVLTRLTGSEFFPGGLGEFEIPASTFLKFEMGPSESMSLQWATYKDAADQCSLSRIWGGIHPPQDDVAGRKIGREVGIDAFEKATTYFEGLASE